MKDPKYWCELKRIYVHELGLIQKQRGGTSEIVSIWKHVNNGRVQVERDDRAQNINERHIIMYEYL